MTDRLGCTWLTSSPSVLRLSRDPRVFSSGLPPILARIEVRPLLHFDATLAPRPSARRPHALWPSSTEVAWHRSSLPERLDPSAFPDESALLFTSEEASRMSASHSRSPAPRVWLPSRRCQPLPSLEASFSSQRSWASPFEAFLLPDGRKSVSTLPLRSDASLSNLVGLTPAFQRLAPIR